MLFTIRDLRQVDSMLAYCSELPKFLSDVSSGRIEQIIEQGFETSFGHRTSPAELRSWKNSLLALSNILNNPRMPTGVGVGVEFQIPKTSKRIDVMLSGINSDGDLTSVIIELKQWESATKTSMDGIVKTFIGGGYRNVSHPSYQVWSYSQLLRDFAAVVEQKSIQTHPCSYLHNMANLGDLANECYLEHVDNAPIFTGLNGQMLLNFICTHIVRGDACETLNLLANSEIAPSKSLADALHGMIEGNEEFVLLDEQKVIFERALSMSSDLESKQVYIVRGGPGTGKSVLAINLLSRLVSGKLNARYITKNAAPRAVYESRLSGHMRKSRISALFTGSGSFVNTSSNDYDVLIVDEAHRLNAKSGLYGNLGENQIKEIINSSKLSIFFIDEYQKIHIRDVGSEELIRSYASGLGAVVYDDDLVSQFRCGGSDGYLAWIDNTLERKATANTHIDSKQIDFQVFDNPTDLHAAIRSKNSSGEKSRVVAGYCWDWVSKKNPQKDDIILSNGAFSAQWNLTEHGSLWIEKDESIEEVGCIHTCQGLELDYVGVIIGPDLRCTDGAIIADVSRRSKSDASIRGLKKMMKENPSKAEALGRDIVLNTYRTLLTRGMKGCYVYCTDPELALHFKSKM